MYAKILYFNFTDKTGYGLSHYNVEVMHIRWNNEESETRRIWKKYDIHAKQSKAGNSFDKIKNKWPKIHYFALKLYTAISKLYSWVSKSGALGGLDPQGPHPWIR